MGLPEVDFQVTVRVGTPGSKHQPWACMVTSEELFVALLDIKATFPKHLRKSEEYKRACRVAIQHLIRRKAEQCLASAAFHYANDLVKEAFD